MKRKELSVLVLVIALLLSAGISTGCGLHASYDSGSSQDQPSDEDVSSDFEDPAFENEADGAEPVMVAHDIQDFIGKWSAASLHAQDMFGNVDLDINRDGSWTGNITKEDFSGKWTHDGSCLNIRDSSNLVNWKLFFVKDGSLMFSDQNDPELSPLVLKKK